ncbi:hypothetical protein I6A60_00565 [Frankia sp. AgB1.9]|uniref:DUF6011 domain-containing protein n=1 Tax=unclassified Frankia TaxID=2632575 RepID=UPI0019334F55|nr:MULTISPECIES: DUF6011 domain-containing protein [unclassified Frankia]MBL7487373.1 hypothetical protein [Frankia sp. AgW1.1]MBL7546381.1 hypothetical protein [Frankia sp. AgB1.9]MBL7618574.1 hypothetical protein [Frankia sp. AgB1.8]
MRTAVATAEPPDGRPRCRICSHPLTAYRSIALTIGPCCARRVHPRDLRHLAATAAKATKTVTVQTSFPEFEPAVDEHLGEAA